MMRKLFLFLLGLLFWGVAYSTPASILEHIIEPTEEQKTEFFRKAMRDPELYSYNPMQVGNVWYYVTDWFNPDMPDTPQYVGRTIIDSMYIEGNIYYKWGDGPLFGFWMRNIDDVTVLWGHHEAPWYNDLDEDLNTDILIHQDFNITNQDPTNPVTVWGLYGPIALDACYYEGSGWINIYGQISQYRDYIYSNVNGCFVYSVRWIRGFGPVSFMTDESCAYLVGCIINGSHFGSTANEDETTTEVNSINIHVYPNPSQGGFYIQYQIPLRYADSILRVYNLRGQVVLQKTLFGSGEYHWDGRDEKQNRLASGIYLIQIVSTQGISTIKKVTVK